MLQLGQLHFELAFEAARALRENIQDEPVTIEHAPARQLLQIALLARRERVVDEDDVGRVALGDRAQLISLAAAEEVARIGALAPSGYGRNRLCACRLSELRELLQIFGLDRGAEPKADQNGFGHGLRPTFQRGRSDPARITARSAPIRGSLEHGLYSAGVSGATVPSSAVSRTFRAGTTVEIACL